jgi:head-tail adaptor
MTGEFAGTLREQVIIEAPGRVQTAAGLQDGSWAVVGETFAQIVPEGAGLDVEASALSALPRYRVTMRFGPDVLPGYRLLWGQQVLFVRQALFDPRRPDRVTLRCEEGR